MERNRDDDGVIRQGPPREQATDDLSRAQRLAAGHDAERQGRQLDGDQVREMRQRMAANDGSLEQKFGEDAANTPEGRKAGRQRSAVAARARRVSEGRQEGGSRPKQSKPMNDVQRRVAEGQRNLAGVGRGESRSQERGREQEAAGR